MKRKELLRIEMRNEFQLYKIKLLIFALNTVCVQYLHLFYGQSDTGGYERLFNTHILIQILQLLLLWNFSSRSDSDCPAGCSQSKSIRDQPYPSYAIELWFFHKFVIKRISFFCIFTLYYLWNSIGFYLLFHSFILIISCCCHLLAHKLLLL